MSYMDQRRDPVPPPDMAAVDARQPGTSSAPAVQYRSPVPSAGHRIPGYRHRVQVQINSQSSERLDVRTAAILDAAVEGLSDRDHHELLRAKAIGTAVGAHLRAADAHAGYLSTGEHGFTRLRGSHDTVRWIFGIGASR